MAAIGESRLKADLKSKSLTRVYFLYGEEHFLVKMYADRILSIAVPDEARDMNAVIYRISTADDIPTSSELEDFLMSVPFFSEYKCAVIEDLDPSALDNSAFKAYLALIEKLPETSVLVFAMTNFTFDLKKPKANVKKLLETCNNAGATVNFETMPQSTVMAMAIRKAQKAGCSLSNENAALLAEECGNSLTELQNEVEKLCAYRQNGEITRDDIEKLVPRRIDSNIYNLAKELFAGRTAAALEILGNLFWMQTDPIYIMSALSAHFTDLYRAKLGQLGNKSANDAAKAFGYPPNRFFVMRNAYNSARNLSERYLARCVAVLYRQNKLLNSSKSDKRLIIERAVVEIAELERQ